MPVETTKKDLVKIENLQMHFPIIKGLLNKPVGYVKAVDGVTFSIKEGETFGLVGESGCGKTTTGKCILRIHKPTAGSIMYNGVDLATCDSKHLGTVRRELQMIFQDPYSSLDPRQSVFSILEEAIKADDKKHSPEEIVSKVDELLNIVGLNPNMSLRYPHEMSGGQRQRLGIARALACNPKLIVCDEPVSALDVSIQAQIINLFIEIQKKLNLTYLFVAHDLAVVRHISDRIGVMYLGKIVEITTSEELYSNPAHPYTQALLSAVPTTDYDVERSRQRIVLQGEVPSPINAPSGCPFHPRCIYATEECKKEMPELKEYDNQHYIACYHPQFKK